MTRSGAVVGFRPNRSGLGVEVNAPVPPKRLYRFGLFEADAESGNLMRGGVRVKLQDQPFRMLCLLLEHHGQVVTREEIRQSLWSEDTYVEFDGSLNAALKRLRFALGDSADNPIFIETLPKRGYRFLAPVAAGESAPITVPVPPVLEETRSAKDDDSSGKVVRVAAEPPKAGWHSRAAYAAALVMLAILGVSSYHRLTSARDNSPVRKPLPESVTPRRSVAVIGFNNASGRSEDEWLSTALSEMMSTELATGEKLRLVSAEDVANLRLSSPWSQSGTLAQATTARIGTALNSDVLGLGSYTSFGIADRSQLRLDVRLQDARTGEILAEVAETGSSQDLLRVTSQAGTRLRERLGVGGLAQADEAGVLASLPQDRDTARLYALGLVKLREFDALAAKDLLEQASRADPKFALAHLMLARAWSQLGYEQKRKEEAKRALDLSSSLPRVERMLVEGDYYESLADHEKAASTYRALFELFPDSVEFGLLCAGAEGIGGHASQALEILAQLRQLPKPASDDPRIDLQQGRLAKTTPESVALDRAAMSKASSQGKKLVYASGERDECMSMIYGQVENPDQAIPLCEDAYKIYLAAGNRPGAADAVRLIADLQGNEGHSDQAIATYQRALKILQGLGEHAKIGAVLNNMAIHYTNQGKLDRGEQMYRQAKAHFEQAGDKLNTATAIGNIADIFYLRGNLPEAEKAYQQSLDLMASFERNPDSYVLFRLADLELAEGKVKDAHRLAQKAIDSAPPDGFQLDSSMSELEAVLEAEADLKGARQQFQAALDFQQKRNKMSAAAETQVELADVALEEGHPEQTESLLRTALDEFEKEKSDLDAASAYLLLSRTQLKQGKVDEARKAIQRAAELGRASPDPAMKMPIAIQGARVDSAGAGSGAAGNATLATARQKLRSVRATAVKFGYYSLECAARLALGELEMKLDSKSARAQLTTLQAEARSHGLELVARRAEQALKAAD